MTDQLPPHSPDDERLLLACIMDSRDALIDVLGSVRESSFYDLRNAKVWREIERREAAGEPCSMADVAFSFRGDMRNHVVGLGENLVSPHQAPAHLSRIVELEQKRSVIHGCARLDEMARNGSKVAELADAAESMFKFDITAPAVLGGHDSARVLQSDLERRFALQGALSGIGTGWKDLDEMTDGFQPGEMTIIGARPSIGKTAIGINTFANAVFRLKIPSLFYSLEMSTAALMRRMLSAEKRIPMQTLRKGSYSERDFQTMTAFQVECKQAPMHIVDSGSDVAEVCATIRRAHRRHGVKFVVIDYLQKIKPSSKHEKRTYEVGDISGRIKAMAKQLGIHVLALAQLSREPDKDKGRMPKLADLADSAQLERDGDVVCLLHRDRNEAVGPAQLIVAKQRDGEVGMVNLTFLGQFCRFESAARPKPEPQDTWNHED